MTILDDIVAAKRIELEKQRSEVPLAALKELASAQEPALSLSHALTGDRVRLIAEVKKASPSKGVFQEEFNPVGLAQTYAASGAAAISVLTDSHFQGTLEHLTAIKQATRARAVPVLRKDFIFDPYQVYEARAAGADAFLLIVAILSPAHIVELHSLGESLGMQSLVEVHDEAELTIAVDAGANIIGINNRNLHTFVTDLAVTERLAQRVPRGKVIVSESGIATAKDVERLSQYGVNAVLVGEALLTSADIASQAQSMASVPARSAVPSKN